MTERYRPTRQEVENSRFSPDKLKLSGDRIFFTFQGEGASLGKPAVFLRLQDCNLKCDWCDTPYTWQKDKAPYWQEAKSLPIGSAVNGIKEAWKGEGNPRLVITGGEPMIQQKQISSLLRELSNWDIEIETNGTIKPIDELKDVQFNVSPKLFNSGNQGLKRYNPTALSLFNILEKTNFKFVVSSEEDIAEIKAIVLGNHLDKDKVYIMPEGITVEALDKHTKLVQTLAEKEGYQITDRLQIRRYGQKRRV